MWRAVKRACQMSSLQLSCFHNDWNWVQFNSQNTVAEMSWLNVADKSAYRSSVFQIWTYEHRETTLLTTLSACPGMTMEVCPSVSPPFWTRLEYFDSYRMNCHDTLYRNCRSNSHWLWWSWLFIVFHHQADSCNIEENILPAFGWIAM